MEILIHFRPAYFLAFPVGVLVMIYAVANRDEMIYLVGAATAFGGLTAFLATEAFGRIAKTRSKVSRWTARVFFVPGLLISGSVLFLLGRWGFSHVGL